MRKTAFALVAAVLVLVAGIAMSAPALAHGPPLEVVAVLDLPHQVRVQERAAVDVDVDVAELRELVAHREAVGDPDLRRPRNPRGAMPEEVSGDPAAPT